jgi:hypothetical protein
MACLDLSTRFVWALLLAHRAVDPPSSLAEGRTPPLAPPRCGARLPDARSMRGDPHTELTSENASNKTRSEQSGLGSRRRLEDKRAAHDSSFCERGRQRRTPTRDPRERSEQSNLGSRADDWRTNEQHTLFVLRERTTTSDSHARSARAERAIKSRIARRRLEDKRAAHALRSAREDDNVGLPRAIRASGASNQILSC